MSNMQCSDRTFVAYLEKYEDGYYEFIFLVNDTNAIIANIDFHQLDSYTEHKFYIHNNNIEDTSNEHDFINDILKVNAYYKIDVFPNKFDGGLKLNFSNSEKLYSILSLDSEKEWYISFKIDYDLIESASDILEYEKRMLDKVNSLKKKFINVLLNGLDDNSNYKYLKWVNKNNDLNRKFAIVLSDDKPLYNVSREYQLYVLINEVIPNFSFSHNRKYIKSTEDSRLEKLEFMENILRQVMNINKSDFNLIKINDEILYGLRDLYLDYEFKVDSFSRLLNILNPQYFPLYNYKLYSLLEYLEFEHMSDYRSSNRASTYNRYIDYIEVINEMINSFKNYSLKRELLYNEFNYYHSRVLNFNDLY